MAKPVYEGIVESGYNTNGSYIKFMDGTMICTRLVAYTGIQITTSQGNMYSSASLELPDFPVAFSGIPAVSLSVSNSTWFIASIGTSTDNTPSATNPGKFVVTRGSSTGTGTVNFTVSIIAIGRWK